MKFAMAMFSVFWYLGLVIMSSSSIEEAFGPRQNMRICALDSQWMLESCDFTHSEDVPRNEVVLVGRSCSGVAFQEFLVANDRSCDNAYNLLLEQKEEIFRLKSSISDPCFYNRKFYCKYRQSRPEKQEEHSETKTSDGVLRIPRYIRFGASTHRLVIVNILESRDNEGAAYHYLQLSYEDVPSQCRSSKLFKPSQAKTLKVREVKYGSCGLDHLLVKNPGDSDGDTNIVKLAVAAELAECLGQSACVQVGRGGYSTSHEGMVHAFLVLMPESCQIIKKFMDENAADTGVRKEFVRTWGDRPDCNEAFLGFLNSSHDSKYSVINAHTYRAIVSNHREESMCTSGDRLGNEMMLLPIRGGVMTIGSLHNFYCIRYFGKHKGNTIHTYSSETLPPRRGEAFEGACAGCRCF